MDFKELLTNAQNGQQEAIEALFEMYRPLLLKSSFVNGAFDEDLFQEHCLHFMSAIKNFKVDYDDPDSQWARTFLMRMAVIVSIPLPAQALSLFAAEFYLHPNSCAAMVRSLLLCRCHRYILESVFASRRVSPPAGCDCDGIALPVCKQLFSAVTSHPVYPNLGGFCIRFAELLNDDTFFYSVQLFGPKLPKIGHVFLPFFQQIRSP